MPNIKPLSPETHSGKNWKRFTSYDFAVNTQVVPLVAAEISHAMQTMPLAFVKQEEKFKIVGLLSPVPAENHFVDSQGRWLGGYVPSFFRGYPFSLARLTAKNDMLLCVDEDSGLVSDTEGEPLFGKDGKLSQAVSQVMDFLQQVENNRSLTDQAVAALSDAGVLAAWELPNTKTDAAAEVSAPMLHRIDEKKLYTLDDVTFLKLKNLHALPIAYAQLFSMVNIAMFEKLASLRGTKEEAPVPDLDQIFGEQDMFKF